MIVVATTRSLLLTVVLMCGLVDLVRSTTFGPVSGLGLATALYAASSWLNWSLRPRLPRDLTTPVLIFGLFIVWGVTSAILWSAPTMNGAQNLLVIIAFLGLILLTATECRRTPSMTASIGKMLDWATSVASVLFVLSYYVTDSLLGFGVGARSFALFALIATAWNLAGWRYGSRKRLLIASGIIGLVGLSLSRTALVLGILLYPIAQFRGRSVRDWWRMVAVVIVACAVLYGSIYQIESLRSRFFEGDVSLHIGPVSINAMGRVTLWNETISSWEESRLIGKGAGSSEILIAHQYPGLAHPHNDYLRILHDYGLIGLGFWAAGYLWLLMTTWRAWQRADRQEGAEARVHLSAFLALLAVALAMITDNVMIYIFAMAPLALLVGASLGVRNLTYRCHTDAEAPPTQFEASSPFIDRTRRDQRIGQRP